MSAGYHCAMQAEFLVCPPAPAARNGADARRQWERFTETLRCAGDVQLTEVAAGDAAPGLVFVARGAFVVGRLAIISSFRRADLRREQAAYRRALASRGLATTYLRESYFEGASDALFDRVRPLCYAGYGTSTERSATMQLQEIVGCRVLPLMLIDERFAHLETALCPLGSGHVLVYMNAFSEHSQTLLRRTIDAAHLIEINVDDALDLACSAVEVGDALVLHGASRALRERLTAIGYRIFSTGLDEFVRDGGSAKTLALRIDDGPPSRGESAPRSVETVSESFSTSGRSHAVSNMVAS